MIEKNGTLVDKVSESAKKIIKLEREANKGDSSEDKLSEDGKEAFLQLKTHLGFMQENERILKAEIEDLGRANVMYEEALEAAKDLASNVGLQAKTISEFEEQKLNIEKTIRQEMEAEIAELRFENE